MNINIEALKWSDTGKRVDFTIQESQGDGFIFPKKEVCSYKLFALGSEGNLKQYKNNEEDLAELIANGRSKWLKSEGKRYYNFPIETKGINVKIYRNQYHDYESE